MGEVRSIHEIPINILQEFIVILRANEDFVGEGKIKDFYISKNEKLASIVYDDGKVTFIANFVKDKLNNWFFVDKVAVRESLKGSISPEILAKYNEETEEESESTTHHLNPNGF